MSAIVQEHDIFETMLIEIPEEMLKEEPTPNKSSINENSELFTTFSVQRYATLRDRARHNY